MSNLRRSLDLAERNSLAALIALLQNKSRQFTHPVSMGKTVGISLPCYHLHLLVARASMQVERCWRLLSETDFIVRRTKVVAALGTGLTTTGARVWYLWLTLDGNDLAPTSAAHIARPEVKGFDARFVKSRIIE